MIDSFLLRNRIIVISGASSGIGRRTAILCNDLGASVILIGRDEEKLKKTKMQFSDPGKAILYMGDICEPSFFENLESFLIQKNYRIDGFVHSAGISPTLPLRILTPDRMALAIETNIKSAFSFSRIFCKPNIAGESLSIVFITSVMASVGASGKSLYGMTKGALVAASKSFAIEYAPKKIRFNTISPGVVISPMSLSSVYSNSAENMQAIESLHPLGFGQPEDIANAAAFLLSKASRWITGTDLIVDGGYTAK